MTIRKKLLNTGLILTGLMITAFLLLAFRKPTPAFDADLMPVRKTVADKENAFPVLAKSAAVIYWPKNKRSELSKLSWGKDWDSDFAADILAKNGEALALFGRAMACADLQVPAFVFEDFGLYEKYLEEWQTLASLASIQAGERFREGKKPEALALALRIVRFGHRVENSGGWVGHYQTGLLIKFIGLRQTRRIARETDLSTEQLITYVAKLEVDRANTAGLTNAFKCEYHVWAKFFEDCASGKISSAYSPFEKLAESAGSKMTFDLERTKTLMAILVRVHLRSIPRHYSLVSFSEFSLQPTNSSMLQRFLRHNTKGEMFAAWLSSDWTAALALKCRENSTISATQLSLALKCFHIKHGRLPDNLGELVPDYLPAVPLDDFDGKPLRYSRERRLVWSVGEDLIDSGGVNSKKEGGPDDILFEIELKTAP